LYINLLKQIELLCIICIHGYFMQILVGGFLILFKFVCCYDVISNTWENVYSAVIEQAHLVYLMNVYQ